jgi:pimeloyl-ACP methyl ester carboxylesterase
MADGPEPLWWEATGDPCGRPLVLVPDAHRPAAAWPAELVAGLVGAGWLVIRLDLRDQGRSPRAGDGLDAPCSCTDLVDDVAADVDEAARSTGAARAGRAPAGGATGPSRPGAAVEAAGFHLLGHGLGGSIALQLAAGTGDPSPVDDRRTGNQPALGGVAHPPNDDRPAGAARPPRIAGLTVVGSTGWAVDPGLPGPDEAFVVGLLWRRRMAADSGADLGRDVAREHRLLTGPADDPGLAGARAAVQRWLDEFNPTDDHRRAWLEGPDLWGAVHGLPVPLTVVHGGADPLLPPAHGRRLAEVAPNARYLEVPGAGHALTPPVVEALLATLAPALH